MAEFLEESTGLESTTIGIYRTAATVQGGRRFSFNALVCVGDRNGSVGLGYAKATGVPLAIEKAQKAARKNIHKITLVEGTLPHTVTGRFCSSQVRLLPASPGTGVIAGSTIRAVLEMAGVNDCLTKSYGSNNQKNLAKAVLQGLLDLRSKDVIAELRGVQIEQTEVEKKLEAGRRFAPSATGEKKQAAPQAKGKKDDKKGKKPGKGGVRGSDKGEKGKGGKGGKEKAGEGEQQTATATSAEQGGETSTEPKTQTAAQQPADQNGSASAAGEQPGGGQQTGGDQPPADQSGGGEQDSQQQ